MTKEFEIWSEGFAVTGQIAGAHYHGSCRGEDFEDACKNFAKENEEFAHYFNENYMSHWGCKLFDNEAEARKHFG